jgi:hypothetical protein
LPQLVLAGERPAVPEDWPGVVQRLIKRCWDHDPDARPSAEECSKQLKKVVQAAFTAHKRNKEQKEGLSEEVMASIVDQEYEEIVKRSTRSESQAKTRSLTAETQSQRLRAKQEQTLRRQELIDAAKANNEKSSKKASRKDSTKPVKKATEKKPSKKRTEPTSRSEWPQMVSIELTSSIESSQGSLSSASEPKPARATSKIVAAPNPKPKDKKVTKKTKRRKNDE